MLFAGHADHLTMCVVWVNKVLQGLASVGSLEQCQLQRLDTDDSTLTDNNEHAWSYAPAHI